MRLRGALVLWVALGTAELACSYSPNFESGSLLCGPNDSCPQGYTCASGACWKNGDLSADGGGSDARGGAGGGAGGAGGAGGTGGDAGNATLKFIHHWVFDSTGRLEETCNNIAQAPVALTDDFVDITAGTSSALIGSYFCPWNLDLAAADKTHTVIVSGQSCRTTSAGMDITMHGDQFDFQTTDGVSGTITASFSAEYVLTPTFTCTFRITGRLTAMP